MTSQLFLYRLYLFLTEGRSEDEHTEGWIKWIQSELWADVWLKPANDLVNKWLRDGHWQGHRLLPVNESGATFSVQRQAFSSSINGAEFRNLIESQLNMSRQIGVSLTLGPATISVMYR